MLGYPVIGGFADHWGSNPQWDAGRGDQTPPLIFYSMACLITHPEAPGDPKQNLLGVAEHCHWTNVPGGQAAKVLRVVNGG